MTTHTSTASVRSVKAKSSYLVSQLVRALDTNQIVPYFQPIVELRSGQVSGFEVLARWNHPERGLVPPDAFIPAAESAGLIQSLTEAILKQAFSAFAAQKLPARPLGQHPLLPNWSIHCFPRSLNGSPRMSGFPLHRLTVEVTEKRG